MSTTEEIEFNTTSLSNTTSTPGTTEMLVRFKIVRWCISTFGFFSNLFVIVVIILYAPLRKQLTNIFIINQSAMDAAAAVSLCFEAIFEIDGIVLTAGNIRDELICRVWYSGVPLWSLLVASAYGIMATTFEKFLAVVYPIIYKTKFTTSKVAIGMLLAGPWIMGLVINANFEIPSTYIRPDGTCASLGYWPSDAVENGVGVLIVIVEYFVPFFFLIFCYTKMALVLHRRVEPMQETGTNQEVKRNESMARARSNVIKTLALVGVLFFVCWTLNIFNLLLNFLGYPYVNFAGDFYSFTVYMVFLNCCVNPVIYSLKYDQFQKGVKHLFCRK